MIAIKINWIWDDANIAIIYLSSLHLSKCDILLRYDKFLIALNTNLKFSQFAVGIS